MAKPILFLVLQFCGTLAYAQFQMSRESALADLKFLVEQIAVYNPGLDLYNPEFKTDAHRIMAQVPAGSISAFDYFKRVSELCAASHEAHFGIGDWQDTIHRGFLNNTYRYMPMSVWIIGDHVYVNKDYSNNREFESGAEILAINGRSTLEILDELRTVTCGDGAIQTQKDLSIQDGWAWKYFLYIDQSEQLMIALRNREGIHQEFPLEALTREEQVANYSAYFSADKKEEQDEQFADLDLKANYAILTLPSFDRNHIEEHDVKSAKFYKSVFGKLAENNVSNLVIDLRGNSGGRKEFAEDMLPYIMQDDRGDDYLYRSLSWDGKSKTTKRPKAARSLFSGRILVLVNGRTFSSASTLTRYLKEYGNATVIGQETASRYEGYVAGSKQYITLPESKVVIKIPRYLNEYPISSKQTTRNRGVLPDHTIVQSLQDLENGTDKHMEKAMELIGEPMKPNDQ